MPPAKYAYILRTEREKDIKGEVMVGPVGRLVVHGFRYEWLRATMPDGGVGYFIVDRVPVGEQLTRGSIRMPSGDRPEWLRIRSVFEDVRVDVPVLSDGSFIVDDVLWSGLYTVIGFRGEKVVGVQTVRVGERKEILVEFGDARF